MSHQFSVLSRETLRVLSLLRPSRLVLNEWICSEDLRGDFSLGVVGLVRTRLLITTFLFGKAYGSLKAVDMA